MTRWPTPDELLPVYEPQPLTPLPEVEELPEDSAWLQWDLATKLQDSQMGELQ